MNAGIKVKTKSIVHLGFIGKAWSDYGEKTAITVNACSNDTDMQMVRFSDGHEVYWPIKYLTPAN